MKGEYAVVVGWCNGRQRLAGCGGKGRKEVRRDRSLGVDPESLLNAKKHPKQPIERYNA
jgi:hypothetical protein